MAAAGVLWLGCGDDGVGSGEQIRVSGQVLAYICHPDSTINDTLDTLYTRNTGRPAEVQFSSQSMPSFAPITVTTNSLSEYAVDIPAGTYSITVLTDHSFPDAFSDVDLGGDITLDIRIRYDFADPDTFIVTFTYDAPGVSSARLMQLTEKDFIDTLNARIGDMLMTDSARFEAIGTTGGMLIDYYVIPRDTAYRMWQIVQGTRLEMEDTYYPDNMAAGPRTYGLCPEDFGFDTTYSESTGRGE
jgi:hypothetical protein